MRTALITFALLAMAAADVSHLSNEHMPPSEKFVNEPLISTVIEQHELQELPEQIEYVQTENAYLGAPTKVDTLPVPALDTQPPSAEPYLPPAISTILTSDEQPMSAEFAGSLLPPAIREYNAPALVENIIVVASTKPAAEAYLAPESTAAKALPTEPLQQNLPNAQYLPPAKTLLQEQSTFQQFQAQLLHAPEIPQLPEMQPMEHIPELSPQVPTTAQLISEPAPAHILAHDGYHYKTGGNLDSHFRLTL